MSIILKLQVGQAEQLRRGQDYLWSVIREFAGAGNAFTVGGLWKRSDEVSRSSVSTFIRKLEQNGYIERTGENVVGLSARKEPMFRLVKPQLSAPKFDQHGVAGRQGLANQNMWNVMRRERDGWTAADLSVLASTDEVSVSRNTALAYCTRLEQAGILAVAEKGGPGRPRRWWLKGSANTGPKPPMVLRTKMVFDQNTARVTGQVLAEEDRA